MSNCYSERTYKIYAIQCVKNLKMYIGCTRQTVEQRVLNHFYDLKSGKHTNKAMLKDYKEYGEENFKVYELESNLIHKDIIKEKEYMLKYKTYDSNYGYNKQDRYFKNGIKKRVTVLTGTPDLSNLKQREEE